MSPVPAPPDDLLIRIGVDPTYLPTRGARVDEFERIGRAAYADICSALPKGWTWDNRYVLDFGCGSGRVLRWFLARREQGAHLVGCDIHEPTVSWLYENVPGDVRLYVNQPDPPLPESDDAYDLIYGGSVFSHLTNWAPWLLEMHRILKPGGLLVASIHGRGLWHLGVAGQRGEPWDEDRTGLLVEHYGDGFSDSWGPAVYVSEWWVRAHWGRALDILRFEPTGFSLPEARNVGQAWVVARKPPGEATLTVEDLTAPSGDPREAQAAQRAQWLAYRELEGLRAR